MRDFYQIPPSLNNQYDNDQVLRAYLRWKLPPKLLSDIEPDLTNLGTRVIADIYKLGQEAEAFPPQHIPYDAWGRRIDHIQTSEAWQALDRISAQEKLIAIAYERRFGAWSRVYQFVKLYLFHPSSAIYTCPLAMTDGAARAIELYGDEALKKEAFYHLTHSDPAEFWTSGQWMTERTGGSDVSSTSTIATSSGDHFKLNGDKWFTSATTSQMAMTLARIDGAHEGSKGLSLFYVRTRDENGRLNGIRINRLKDKLGTRALPTAELTLENTRAFLVGQPGDGVKKISSLFNITRIYNACCAVGYMRRGLALAKDYAKKRVAFGRPLAEHGLHLDTLAKLQVEFTGAFHLVFHAVELLGKEELGVATSDEQAILRLLTPLAKLYTAKQSIACVSEILESFGGAGYIEDTGLPQLLRNAQVLSIWEGTTNILSLDLLRAIKKDKSLAIFFKEIIARLNVIQHEKLTKAKNKTLVDCTMLEKYSETMDKMSPEEQQTGARQFSFALTQLYIASLLLEHAEWCLISQRHEQGCIAAIRWCAKPMVELIVFSEDYGQDSRMLALD
jgi:putative acyl-CoA dehydrogenase